MVSQFFLKKRTNGRGIPLEWQVRQFNSVGVQTTPPPPPPKKKEEFEPTDSRCHSSQLSSNGFEISSITAAFIFIAVLITEFRSLKNQEDKSEETRERKNHQKLKKDRANISPKKTIRFTKTSFESN